MPAEVRVHDAAYDGADEHGPESDGKVAQADLDGVVVVRGGELLWEAG